ncbi:MAG: fibronectin type III domain-containing protein [Candidatus Berkelbacteria bacterium]|nr:fibronectin type III domain-containing protein [Candidatus Berkelbacteria bacterium]
MKKGSFVWRFASVFLSLTLIVGIFAGQVEKASAHSSLDQYINTADGYWKIETHRWLGQSFRPTYNKLDGLGVYAGIASGGPASCTLTISVYSISPVAKIAETTKVIPAADSYNIADITAVDTVPDANYVMYVSASSTYAYWLVKTTNAYPRGNAIIDSVGNINQDFVFATFGYNNTPPAAPDPAPVVTPSTPTGGDAGTDTSTAADTSSTSTSISAPTNLVAQAASGTTSGAINLSWTASTTADITGYKILRSVSETSGFVEIGTSDKKTLSYKDEKAVTNQKYYYAVRAYKNSTQSKNSNIASATLTDTTAPTKLSNFKITSQNENEIAFAWDKAADTDLANYILTVAESDATGAKVYLTVDTISKDAVSYTLKLADNSTLVKDKNYTFYLQAKDISNNYSEKATTSGKFLVVVVKTFWQKWMWPLIGAGAIIIIGAAVAIILIVRKRKKLKAARVV